MSKTRINPNTVKRKPQGMSRRRKYLCSVCLFPVYEYPALVMNRSELVCPVCSKLQEMRLQDRE